MRVLLSGGGTAGHIYPALAVAEQLVADGHDVVFTGTPDGLEATLVAEAGVAFEPLKARGFDRSSPLTFITSSALIAVSAMRAAVMLRRRSIDAVLGFGGYVSLPVGIAAALMRVPLALHEQNSVPGLANRILSRWARAVGVTYPGSARYLRHPDRVIVTGNPVRRSVLEADRLRGRRAFGLSEDALVLLVFGGSRGARHLNEALIALAPRLMGVPGLSVLHVAGRIEAGSVGSRIAEALGDEPRYRVLDYVDAMGDALAASDVVIARAGATSLAELTVMGRAAVLVPYPYATDDHQTLNARAVEAVGGAVVVSDAELDTPLFADSVLAILSDVGRRATMEAAARGLGTPDAASRVAGLVRRAVNPGEETA